MFNAHCPRCYELNISTKEFMAQFLPWKEIIRVFPKLIIKNLQNLEIIFAKKVYSNPLPLV